MKTPDLLLPHKYVPLFYMKNIQKRCIPPLQTNGFQLYSIHAGSPSPIHHSEKSICVCNLGVQLWSCYVSCLSARHLGEMETHINLLLERKIHASSIYTALTVHSKKPGSAMDKHQSNHSGTPSKQSFRKTFYRLI